MGLIAIGVVFKMLQWPGGKRLCAGGAAAFMLNYAIYVVRKPSRTILDVFKAIYLILLTVLFFSNVYQVSSGEIGFGIMFITGLLLAGYYYLHLLRSGKQALPQLAEEEGQLFKTSEDE